MDIIIGAGATGLAYASFTTNDYLVIEADCEVGGYCKTIKQDGFVWDYSGHFFHFRRPDLEQYICQYIKPDTILKCHKHTQILYKGKYIDFPFQKNIHQLEKEEFIDCLYDLFNNQYTGSSNFCEMLYTKFGKSIAEKFLIPYNEKLYACNLNCLDINAMGRFFPYADKEDIIANFKSNSSKSYNETFTYPKGGAFEYINSLLQRIDLSKLLLGEAVISIDLEKHILTTTRRSIIFDNLISTIPFPVLLDKCGIGYDKSIYTWNQVLVFNLGFDSKGNDKINNWVYFPDKDLCFYRVGYYDNIFESDRMSLYIELGFYKGSQIDVDKWFERVLEDLRKSGIVTTQKLVSRHHVIMDPAYVHITEKSLRDVSVKKGLLEKSNAYSIGRYGSWTYCSIEDRMVEAQELSKKLQ